MTSPILWQSSDQIVTLIDIPSSIAAAQGTDSIFSSHLLSTPPLQAPFPSNEPKSASAIAMIKTNSVIEELHAEYQGPLQRAIDEVRKNHNGDWCLPRDFVEQKAPPAKKRRLSEADTLEQPTDKIELPSRFLSDLGQCRKDNANDVRLLWPSNSTTQHNTTDEHVETDDTKGLPLHNNRSETAILQIKTDKCTSPFSFHIPPGASFYLGDCQNSKEFRNLIRQHAQETGSRSTFDFILLDPPWPNRSVKRTHKRPGSTYVTSPIMDDVGDLIVKTDLDMLMNDDCLVGIWITNKPSVRDLVLGENGIFDCWGIDLVEEWIWLKTAIHGEPVTALDGIWRKPFEVLLLGRKRRKHGNVDRPEPTSPAVKRRVMIAVPDLHSRKPCLKSLIEQLMQNRKDYRALEVFARHLVAGWWSWGDECIKFNWDKCWRKPLGND